VEEKRSKRNIVDIANKTEEKKNHASPIEPEKKKQRYGAKRRGERHSDKRNENSYNLYGTLSIQETSKINHFRSHCFQTLRLHPPSGVRLDARLK
jgi:hypothetical protein